MVHHSFDGSSISVCGVHPLIEVLEGKALAEEAAIVNDEVSPDKVQVANQCR
jgi:hypothetical protein